MLHRDKGQRLRDKDRRGQGRRGKGMRKRGKGYLFVPEEQKIASRQRGDRRGS